MTDERARQILFKTYWSSDGWKRDPSTLPEDLEYARSKGYMFETVQLSHDELIRWFEKSIKAVRLEDISDAFLASLSTRRLELRSALGSFAIAHNFPNHKYQGPNYCCQICGAFNNPSRPHDLSCYNFERYKWGGVRHESPDYMAFDLEQFHNREIIVPTDDDIKIMRQIIEVASQSELNARPRDLEKKLANVIVSNKEEREILIQILGYCGILQPKNKSGYFRSFVAYHERTLPPVNKIDWKYPVCWWRGINGVNREALAYYFPQIT